MTAMHPIEVQLIDIARSGRAWGLPDIGGVAKLAPEARSLGVTPMLPALLKPLVTEWASAPETARRDYGGVLRDMLDVATLDFVLIEVVDILDDLRPLPDDGDECCFTLLLAKVASSDASLSALARGAALDGAFRFSAGNRRWQLRLLDLFLGVQLDDDPEFLRHAAKIAGVAFSHWRDKELLELLERLAPLAGVRQEATFELGMAALAVAIDLREERAAPAAFRVARDWFCKSAGTAEHCPQTRLYLDGLDLLLSFQEGSDNYVLEDLSTRVRQHAFELHAWAGGQSPSWLGARHTEAVCWSALATSIASITARLQEPSWWAPAAVIEEGLLSVYIAGRAILRRGQDGGVESMVRPRIRTSLASQAGLAHQVQLWLQRNQTHEWAAEAQELLGQLQAHFQEKGGLRNPIEAASGRTTLAAVVAKSTIPSEPKNTLVSVIENAMSLQLRNLTGAEVDIIERCCEKARTHPDHNSNPNGACLFDAVLLWLVRFVFNRLELTQGDDPTGAYLFERKDGTLPHEGELQADFYRWISKNAAGIDLEPTNIASGRADIRLKSGPERLIVEVKREQKDSSFEALSAAYAAQTTDYQNVSVRMGVLLVLDLATPNRNGTPHITSLFEMRQISRPGETQPRLMLIVKVPGRRKRPSDLTRQQRAKLY